MKISVSSLLFTTVALVFAGCATATKPSLPTGSGKKFPAYKGRVEYKSAGEKQVVVARLETGEVYLLRPESAVWDQLAGQTLVLRGTIENVSSTKTTGKSAPEDLWKTKALLIQGQPQSAVKAQASQMPELEAPSSSSQMMPGSMGSGGR